jgi:hypothetical protein
MIARVFLAGRPRTKGHMIARGNRGGAQDRPLLHAWMRSMGIQLQRQLGIRMKRVGGKVMRVDADPYAGPVEVHCFFRFEREESQAAGVSLGQVVASHSTPWPTVIHIGDEDTLRRAVLDALVKNGVIKDDSLSVGGMNYKRWCEEGEEAGVLLVVTEASDPAFLRYLEPQAERGEL